MRTETPKCPAERWEHDARQWQAVAKRLAKMCADLVGCCFDEERSCPEGGQCATCWLNRAVRETAGRRQAVASPDRIEDAKQMFGDIYGQVTWLAERLSEARILVGHDQCSRCQRMSFDACKQCWCQEAAKAIREGRHSK